MYGIGLTGSIVLGLTLCIVPLINVKSVFDVRLVVFIAVMVWVPVLVKWGVWALYISPIYFIVSLYLVSKIDSNGMVKITVIGTRLVVLLMVGAYIATIYHWVGLPSVLEIQFENRRLLLYLSTLSYIYDGYIRPSGIYDEPGALSFVICVVAYLRNRLDFNNRNTIIILFAGLVTGSLAHLIFLLVFLVLSRKSYSLGAVVRGIVLLLVALPLFVVVSDLRYFSVLSNRVSVTEEGRLTGDNRSQLLDSAFQILMDNEDAIMFGLGPQTESDIKWLSSVYGEFETNPLSPVIRAGLIGGIWYYLFVGYYFVNSISSRRRLLMLSICLLLLQRPYVMNYGYSTMLLLILAVDIRTVGLLGVEYIFPSHSVELET
jgi:hypothetical protein